VRNYRLLWLLVIVTSVGVVALTIWEFRVQRQLHDIRHKTEQLAFLGASAVDRGARDEILLNVGTIQFLHRGYSIQLNSVEHGPNGLTLTGQVGNPTQLWISNLTVNFMAATSFDYDEWMKLKPDSLLKPLGTAQSSPISSLAPGKTGAFKATIPNVRQAPNHKNQPVIFIQFTGELYSYPP